MDYSLVIPLKNEEKNVVPLIEEIESVMQLLHKPYELILINDGSKDDTLQQLQKMQRERPFIKIIDIDNSIGQSGALYKGFQEAQAPLIVTMDGDLQNDPKDIPNLLEALKGYDMITGIRANRKDTFIKKLTSKVGRFFRHLFLKDGIKDTGCSLKIFKKECLMTLPCFDGMHRFYPALFQINGFKVTQREVNHRSRTAGKTKYSFKNRSLNTFFDLLAVRWMKNRALPILFQKEQNKDFL